MPILTQIVAAAEEEIELLGETTNLLAEWSGIQMRDVDTGKIVTLHCLLTGDLLDDADTLYEPVYISASESTLVLRFADELLERLAGLDEEMLDDIAAELAATEEFEATGWESEVVIAMLGSLVDLARLAESQGQAVFVCMHTLDT